jgi:cytochrome c oxidase assembly factor CtaG
MTKARLAASTAAFALAALASVGPWNRVAETRLFSVHMALHLVVADLGPLLLAAALPSVPRLVRLHPLAVLGLWTASLYAWHLPVLYDAALRHEWAHALQHVSFFAAGVLLWTTVLARTDLQLGWRLSAVLGAGILSAVLGNVFLWAGHAFYEPYVDAPRLWGLSAVEDQRLGGALMLGEGMLVMLAAFAWIALRWLGEADRVSATR